ncbi:filamentous hemagglutinin N-terminal domain-containing protein, partial [Proteus hauseri]|uniref:two-partner secretion domain-containing protein n=1 Tax=Proteus hauseri TaxID=183417 RepID=UPI0032DBD922
SHNQFHAFNIGKPGVVINNAISPVSSQLAGLVNANPNLDGNAANLVINEVVGNGHSQLLGKLEIAGKQASVLIANQNGITCDGCNFINTPEITLTTGKPSFNSQGLLSAIEVKKGNIVIGEQGMDAESQSYADILSRSIELNGKIKAKNLSLMQGNNRIDFEKGTVNNISGEGNKPTLSIDTKALGGMYANQIRLVSTESGVGVNLSDIQTKQNSLNLTVDGKITFNGNINAKSDINVSTKALQINPDAKLKSEKDITLATNILTNNGEIIAEKDMRLFTDKLSNKGGEALIQAKDNLWIQKNAQGDPSTLIENQSATIKTEQGDLIIRTKKLVNESITPFFKEIKQEPDSNHAVSIGNYLFTPAHNGSKDNFLLVTFFAALKDFVGNKWFDILDLRKNGGVNVERTSFEIDKEYIPSVILSGKNLYLQSNELINEQSKIIVTDNLIATGDNIKSSYYLLGDYNKWDLYFLEEEIDDYFEYYNYDYDESKHNIDKSKLFKEDCFVLHEKAGSYYEFVINDSPEYMLKAGGNLVLDFKNSINLDRKFPFSEKNIKEIKNILTSDNTVLANNILLNSADINISLNLKADNNLSILANKNINIKNASLLTEEAISLTANDNISFEQGVVITKDLSVLSKSGNVNYSLDPAYSYSLSNFAPSIIDVSDKVTFYSGGSILFDNALVNRVNKINLTALENIKIQRNESLLFGLLPNKASNTSISELLLKFGSWEFGNITLTAGKDIVSQGIKYSSDKAITFNAGQDIFLASKSIKEADPFFSDIHYPKLQSKLFANNNIILNAARDIDLT